MKKTLLLSLAPLVPATVLAQLSTTQLSTAPRASSPPAESTPYAVTERGPNHNIWSRTLVEIGPQGQTIPHIMSYTELATGLNYEPPENPGQWAPSSDQLTLQLDGSAVGLQGQCRASFPADIYLGAVSLTTPRGLSLQCRPLD